MKLGFQVVTVALAACAAGNSQQTPTQKPEFDAVAIKAAAPQTGHFRSPGSARGGPGTADLTTFRCSNCTLAFLIARAFDLQRYQFPGQMSLPDTAFDISARVPEGTTPEQFALMLQNMLKERFNLAWHFEKKQVQGYELVVGKNGPRLKEAKAPTTPAEPEPGASHADGAGGDWHSLGNSGGHELARPGLMVFNGQGRYRGDGQTTGDLARMISNQLSRPVDDHTGLQGRYDISLNWSDDGSHAATHPPAAPGGLGHGDHGGAAPGGAASTDDPSGPGMLAAVQAQLGLRLEPKKATASIFTVDHVDGSPTAN